MKRKLKTFNKDIKKKIKGKKHVKMLEKCGRMPLKYFLRILNDKFYESMRSMH
jgi:hypothetical protein